MQEFLPSDRVHGGQAARLDQEVSMPGPTPSSSAPSRASAGAIAGGAAAAGIAGGYLISRRLRPRRSALAELAREIGAASIRLGRLSSDLQAVREEAGERRRQSPIEVVLAGLTSRRLPRHG
jgi:hypothetical protein